MITSSIFIANIVRMECDDGIVGQSVAEKRQRKSALRLGDSLINLTPPGTTDLHPQPAL